MTTFIDDFISNNNSKYNDDWNKVSLIGLDNNLHNKIVFNHLDWDLYKDGININDVRQGSIGNCYLLAALSAITKRKDLIQKMFYTKGLDKGIIGVWFYFEGKRNLIIIDTKLPTSNNQLVFSYSLSKETWVSLIEKAWSKLHNSYFNTIGGDTNDVINYLTGQFTCSIDLNCKETILDFQSNALWKKMLNIFSSGNFITCGELKKNLRVNTLDGLVNPSSIDLSHGGLVDNHAYTITNLIEIKHRKLIQLRNPWGNFEWHGDWSDKDTINWTNELKSTLDFQNKNDGSFWMSWNDFFYNFSNLQYTLEHYNHTKNFSGKWEKNINCGGVDNNWIYNPTYSIEWSNKFTELQKIDTIFSISQPDTRSKGGGNWLYIIVDIIQNEDNKLEQERTNNNILKTMILNKRIDNCPLEIDINRGKVWIVLSLWEEGRIGEYYLEISSKNNFNINYHKLKSNKNLNYIPENLNCIVCNSLVNLQEPKYTFKQIKWHQNCYKCHNCNISLLDNLYDVKKVNNKYGGYCSDCYINLFSEKCKYCNKIIIPNSSCYKINNEKIHVNCYLPYLKSISPKCNFCNEPLCNIPNRFSGKYYTINNKKIHEECYLKYLETIADKCIVCGSNIYGRFYKTSHGKFHINCYQGYLNMILPDCCYCKHKIRERRYYKLGNNRSSHINCYRRNRK